MEIDLKNDKDISSNPEINLAIKYQCMLEKLNKVSTKYELQKDIIKTQRQIIIKLEHQLKQIQTKNIPKQDVHSDLKHKKVKVDSSNNSNNQSKLSSTKNLKSEKQKEIDDFIAFMKIRPVPDQEK